MAWAKKADGTTDDFDYTPATQSTKGKLSFKMELTLTGAKDAGMTTGVTETISVENVEVVDEADKYQTAEELQAKIKDLGTAAKPITGATVPTGANDTAALAAAKTALETAIATVNKTTPAITVTVENVAAADGVTATTYTTTPTGEGVTPTKGEYKNVKITIGTAQIRLSLLMILFSQCRFLIEYFTEKENEKKYIKRWKKAAGFPAACFKLFQE